MLWQIKPHNGYISFYFDTKQMIQKTTYELGLLIYDVDENGKPGNELCKKDVRFFLKEKGKGKIKLNISDLALNAQENLFLGFEILDDIYQRPLLVEFVEGKQSVSYYKEINDIWRSPVNDVPYQLKLQIDVAPF